jgi:hypothetical protein
MLKRTIFMIICLLVSGLTIANAQSNHNKIFDFGHRITLGTYYSWRFRVYGGNCPNRCKFFILAS